MKIFMSNHYQESVQHTHKSAPTSATLSILASWTVTIDCVVAAEQLCAVAYESERGEREKKEGGGDIL